MFFEEKLRPAAGGRLRADMRLIALFFVSVAVGVAGYLVLVGPGAQPTKNASDSAAPAQAEAGLSRATTPEPLPAAPSPPEAPPPSRPPKHAAQTEPPLLPFGRAGVERRAEAVANRERLDRSDVRTMLETALGAMLPDRVFSENETERLTDAVMRIRAARRVLKRVPPSVAAADVLARERTALTDALADFQEVTGLDPSELTEILEPDGGLSNDDDPNIDSPEPTGDEAPEYLQDLEPPP